MKLHNKKKKTQPEEVEKEEETQSKLGSRTNPVPFRKPLQWMMSYMMMKVMPTQSKW